MKKTRNSSLKRKQKTRKLRGGDIINDAMMRKGRTLAQEIWDQIKQYRSHRCTPDIKATVTIPDYKDKQKEFDDIIGILQTERNSESYMYKAVKLLPKVYQTLSWSQEKASKAYTINFLKNLKETGEVSDWECTLGLIAIRLNYLYRFAQYEKSVDYFIISNMGTTMLKDSQNMTRKFKNKYLSKGPATDKN